MIKMPTRWNPQSSNQTTSKVTASTTVDAVDGRNLGEGNEGMCPITGKQMVRMKANGHDAWVSLDQRIVLPIKD